MRSSINEKFLIIKPFQSVAGCKKLDKRDKKYGG